MVLIGWLQTTRFSKTKVPYASQYPTTKPALVGPGPLHRLVYTTNLKVTSDNSIKGHIQKWSWRFAAWEGEQHCPETVCSTELEK